MVVVVWVYIWRMQKVELFDVALKGCRGCALLIQDTTSETSVVATRCEFANSNYGARVQGSLTFDIRYI